jgi:hypothetical protein
VATSQQGIRKEKKKVKQDEDHLFLQRSEALLSISCISHEFVTEILECHFVACISATGAKYCLSRM